MSEKLTPVPPLRSGSPAAAAAAWPWRSADPASAAEARRRALRREGTIRALVGIVVGAILFALGARTVSYIAWGIAGIVLLAALASPDGVYAAIGRAMELLGHVIGRLFAIVFLTPVFFLFFLPFGRLLRSGRRDRLERWFDPAVASYWHKRKEEARTEASFKKAF